VASCPQDATERLLTRVACCARILQRPVCRRWSASGTKLRQRFAQRKRYAPSSLPGLLSSPCVRVTHRPNAQARRTLAAELASSREKGADIAAQLLDLAGRETRLQRENDELQMQVDKLELDRRRVQRQLETLQRRVAGCGILLSLSRTAPASGTDYASGLAQGHRESAPPAPCQPAGGRRGQRDTRCRDAPRCLICEPHNTLVRAVHDA
jgi:hypothetical protein